MKKVLVILLVLVVVAAGIAYSFYGKIYAANTSFEEEAKLFYVMPNSTFDETLDHLEKSILKDIGAFTSTATLKKFDRVKPGRYLIKAGTSNNELINMLRGGWQEPVKVTFNNARSPQELAGKLASYLALDSNAVLSALMDPAYPDKYGFNRETFRTMFIPDTYEMYWTDPADKVFDRMALEYKTFWNEKRKKQAKKLGLSQSEVSTLASVVKAETAMRDEAPRVAGVYLNRLDRGIALQADPTLIYALGDFSIRRVLDKHKEIDSPYNTYRFPGLPPGPINYPSSSYIDAVLNPEQHSYIYFCAKEDFSGYHNFAKSYQQHLVNARRYQSALNKQGVYR